MQPDPNAKPNLNPIQTDPPKFIKQVKNGKLYSVGSGEDLIYLVHVWGGWVVIVRIRYYWHLWCLTSTLTGSPYEMGYAHGQLMQERAKSMMNDVWSYLKDQVVGTVHV